MTAAPRVTVVIPSWNGRALLDDVLGSLAGQRYRDFEVVVVDNGSTDGSVAHLRSEHPDVGVVALDANAGFAPAVNAGIARARGAYVALLNNDMELDPGWLGALVAALDAHPRAGSAASKLRMLRDPERLDGAGDQVTWYGAVWRRGHGTLDDGRYDAPGEIATACAGAALYRRAAIEDVGGFDESFFAYLEDTDWGLRAQLSGWGCRWVPDSVAFHLGGATSRRIGDLEAFLVQRNTAALVLKDFPARRLALWAPLILAYQGWTLVRGVTTGTWRPVLRGWAGAVRRLPSTLRARREVQARRRAGGVARLDAVLLARPPVRPRLPRR